MQKTHKVHNCPFIDIIVQRNYQFHMAILNPDCTIKLVSIDVDNTLVDSCKKVPEDNIKAIRWAHEERGVHFAINSGRIEKSARHYMDVIGVHECFPSLGGVILHSWEGDILEEHSIAKDASLGILSIARSLGVALFAYTHEMWHLDSGNDYWADSEFKATGVEGKITDIGSFLQKYDANKMLGACLDVSAVSELERQVRLLFSDKVECFKSSQCFLEILPKGINKGTAINALCKHYCLEKANVMSIGDYYNDIDMFKASGISVAMPNAPDSVKALADYVTQKDSDHCAVAEAIYRFIV